MKLSLVMLSVLLVNVGCGAVEPNDPSASTEPEAQTPHAMSEEDGVLAGDCCYADCGYFDPRTGGTGICEDDIGKVPSGECASRAKGYCRYRGLIYAYSRVARCTGKKTCP